MEDYIDSDGNVIVSKSIRPIIDYPETILGAKRGAKRQFRYGNLHVREYKDHYTVHLDTIDPRKDPLGHLIVDAPEYLVGLFGGLSIAMHIASIAHKRRTSKGHEALTMSSNNMFPGIIAGLIISTASFLAVNFMKKWTNNNCK